MSQTDKKSKTRSDLGVGAERAATAQLGDRSSDKLRRSASAVGNEELKTRIESGKSSRDELLEFLATRLRTIRGVQEKEVGLTTIEAQNSWWRQVGDKGKEEYSKPDPTRWREVARTYEEAAYQLCRGALGRGKMLVERAMTQEKEQIGSTTKLVELDDVGAEFQEPSAMAAIGGADACPEQNMPAEIKSLSNEIQNVTSVAQEPPNRKRIRDPWWTLEEEEEEEEAGGEGA